MNMRNTRKFNLYKPHLKLSARGLRNNQTKTEKILWNRLKGKQVLGCKFTRQKPIDKYIVDFYCHELKLVIEIDGFTHDFKIDYDNKREKVLKNLGLNILKFNDERVYNNIEEVVQNICDWIEPHTPQPPLKGGGKIDFIFEF